MKRIVPIVVSLTLAFNSKFAMAGSLDRQIGTVVTKEHLVCFIAVGQNIKTGSQVNLVLLSVPQRVVSGKVISVSDRKCAEISKAYNFSGKSYRLSLSDNRTRLSVPAIGILNAASHLHRDGFKVIGDIDGDGIEESFRSCASSEGIHLTVWSGQPLTGTRKWHAYYYLGYDVEPTCTESEVKNNSTAIGVAQESL